VWATLGAIAFVVFAGWSLLAFRASAFARAALDGDDRVAVEYADAAWSFHPRLPPRRAGLLFFPGGMVDPVAYAPLLRGVAVAGYPALLVELPRRGAFGGADSPDVFSRARAAMRRESAVVRWVVAGHSLGGAVAARMAHEDPAGLAALVLIGTTHPRDFSLAASQLQVTRVYGTRDTVADVSKQQRTRGNLPASARLVAIDGGNHSQFGYYGFQPGDWPATISREEQQRLTLEALLSALSTASSVQ
jgi:pimeloyl-ACP methyl ester carboxylesterase